ncbi:MAG TPA: thiamine pyrophosphate-binding protein [bacterium]|nr:thiamine pyrophosphate-binding protein [bacterium]
MAATAPEGVRVPASQGLAETLVRYGVKYVFGMRIIQEADPDVLVPICIHHENTATLMAYAYARVSGRVGVAAINRPGNPNALLGMHEALQSSGAMVVLMDGVPAAVRGKHALYEMDTEAMVRAVSKAVVEAPTLARYPERLRTAFRLASTGRPGPVVLHMTAGFRRGETSEPDVEVYAEEAYATFPAHRPPPEPQLVARAAELLRTAERPCIIAGGGVNLSRAWEELAELAELTQFPVATTISGKGAFNERHPLSVGATGSIQGGRFGRGRVAERIVKASDVVLLVGSRTNEMATSAWTVPDPKSTIIHIDIDPAEIGRNYRTEVGIVADAKAALAALVAELRRAAPKARPRSDEIRRLMDEWREDNSVYARSDQVPIHPARLVHEICRLSGPNTILVSDGSSPFMWASSHFLVDAGPTFLSPRGTGAIGTGLPMALGAKLAAPERDVICLEGDGGITCGPLAELETAARCRIGVTVIVFNNGVLGHERYNMWGRPAEYMAFLPMDFAAVARGLHCEGIRVEQPSELWPAIERGVRAGREGRPTLIDVVIDPTQYLRNPEGFKPGETAGH